MQGGAWDIGAVVIERLVKVDDPISADHRFDEKRVIRPTSSWVGNEADAVLTQEISMVETGPNGRVPFDENGMLCKGEGML